MEATFQKRNQKKYGEISNKYALSAANKHVRSNYAVRMYCER